MATIMLVEDDPTMRSLLKTLLELEGFKVLQNLETTPDAISREILQAKPNAILMDVHLKGANGLAILEEIRAHPDGKSIRVMMASGLDVSEACKNAGADKFLLKPYNPDELIRWFKKESSSP